MIRRAGRWSRIVASGTFLAVLAAAGACTLAMDLDVLKDRVCAIGEKECNGRCVPLSDPDDECGVVCESGERECNGICVPEGDPDNQCGVVCESGEKECNGICVPESDPDNECGAVCEIGEEECNGICVPEGDPDNECSAGCGTGEKECNGACVAVSDPATGCGAASCDPCDIANGTAACAAGACGVGRCEPAFDDCNGDPADGCEVNLSSNPDHCGLCDDPCPAGWSCRGGECRERIEEFWDDLNYSGLSDPALIQNGWLVRSAPGKPGVPGATWEPHLLEFKDEFQNEANRTIVVAANTEGDEARATRHSEIVTADQRFLHGTYAARIYFVEEPEGARDTDKPALTFFTFGPALASDDPENGYVGMSAYYLPNGGMGQPDRSMRLITRGDTSEPDAIASDRAAMAQGWHTIVITANSATREIAYSIDGLRVASHKDSQALTVYPKLPMGIGLSVWFLEGEIDASNTEHRSYYEEVDWVYYAKDKVLTRAEVELKVQEFRNAEIVFSDSMP